MPAGACCVYSETFQAMFVGFALCAGEEDLADKEWTHV